MNTARGNERNRPESSNSNMEQESGDESPQGEQQPTAHIEIGEEEAQKMLRQAREMEEECKRLEEENKRLEEQIAANNRESARLYIGKFAAFIRDKLTEYSDDELREFCTFVGLSENDFEQMKSEMLNFISDRNELILNNELVRGHEEIKKLVTYLEETQQRRLELLEYPK